ncbi:MAG TPA: hypothetical protein VH186_38670 [Chloroflexia bacterium]|nr:hypothetical protein [Chloroflexia bacterium]
MTDSSSNTPARRGAKTEKEVSSASSSQSGNAAFEPRQYLEYRDGLPYLPLKWRLTWLRTEHPRAKVSTRLVSHENGVAIFSAEVELPEGGLATGWGVKGRATRAEVDHEEHFDYIVAAENQALGRALSALGYGTEYALDYDPPAENQPIVLPEQPIYGIEEEEKGIEVPFTIPAEEPLRPVESAVTEKPAPEEPEPEEDEEDLPESSLSRRPAPVVPIPTGRGEVRSIMEKRPPAANRPAPRPATSEPPAPVPIAAAPSNLSNPAVDERIKNVRDEQLRVTIKQIYYEARRLFSYDENRVDDRSREIYNKPTYELDLDEAEKYLERIKSAPRRRT